MGKKYTSDDIVQLSKKMLDIFNFVYGTSVSISLDHSLNFDETYYSGDFETIHLGTSDIGLDISRKNNIVFSLQKTLEILQYVAHEYFHGQQEKQIKQEPYQNPLLTTDFIISELSYDIYRENHTISMIEVDAEFKSWNALSIILPFLLDVNKKTIDNNLCKLFASRKNEFYDIVKPNILDDTFMNIPGSTIEDLNTFIEQLRNISKNTLRDIPSTLEDYIDTSEAKNPVEQNLKIIQMLPNINSTNPTIIVAQQRLKIFLSENPEIHKVIDDLLSKNIEPEPGS